MLIGSLCSQHDLHHEGDDIAAGYAVSETNQCKRVWGADPIKMPAADIYGCQGETCSLKIISCPSSVHSHNLTRKENVNLHLLTLNFGTLFEYEVRG